MFEDVWKSYDENELTHSAAHHLMAVHELRTAHGYARVSDIAQHLKITKGSVSSAMKHLKERGYVQEDHNRFLELTDRGLLVVQEIEATRLAVKKFLSDALGMDEDDAEIDACKVEHLVSSDARQRLVRFLGFLFSVSGSLGGVCLLIHLAGGYGFSLRRYRSASLIQFSVGYYR